MPTSNEALISLIAQAYDENWEELDLSRKELTDLPKEIAQLTKLTQLNLSNNQITSIPDSIAQLIHLTTLQLSSNQITSIPDSIAQLTNLTQLQLSFNQIISIPDSIAQLTNLKRLSLTSNPIQHVPLEIIHKWWGKETYSDGKPQIIFTYLKSVTKRPLNGLKTLLLGEGDIGKTSHLNRLTKNTFTPNS